MNNNFNICKGYSEKKTNKKLIFFHTPKSAGTTFCNLISNLIPNSLRLNGPLTPLSGFKDTEYQLTAYENYEKNIFKINKLKPNFIYGHFPFCMEKNFSNKLTATLLRDPISRSISHYNFKFQRNNFYKNFNIEQMFKRKIIPDNLMVRQFSNNINNEVGEVDLKIAIKNLTQNINFLFSVDQTLDLINLIISIYDLPNVLFQNSQITKKIFLEKNKKNISIIKMFNKYDLILYKHLLENNLFSKLPKKIIKREKNSFFYFSNNMLIKNKKLVFLNNDQANNIINDLSQINLIDNEK